MLPAMMRVSHFRFAQRPDEHLFRTRLRATIGARLERTVDVTWRADPAGDGGRLNIESMSSSALRRGVEICVAMGGEPVWRRLPPAWTHAPRLRWTRRLGRWLGLSS
jgi:hypothetical protein